MLAKHSPGPRWRSSAILPTFHILLRLPPSTCSRHHIWRNTAVVTVTSHQHYILLPSWRRRSWSSLSQCCMAIVEPLCQQSATFYIKFYSKIYLQQFLPCPHLYSLYLWKLLMELNTLIHFFLQRKDSIMVIFHLKIQESVEGT